MSNLQKDPRLVSILNIPFEDDTLPSHKGLVLMVTLCAQFSVQDGRDEKGKEALGRNGNWKRVPVTQSWISKSCHQ